MCKGHINNTSQGRQLPLNPLATNFQPGLVVTAESIQGDNPNELSTTRLSTLSRTPDVYDLSTPTLSALSNPTIGESPIARTLSTPNLSEIRNVEDDTNNVTTSNASDLGTSAFMAFILILSSYIVNAITTNTYVPTCSGVSNVNPDDAINILREIRVKNVNRVIIGTLNINSLPSKFEQLKLIIGNFLDVLVIQETKLDPSFPSGQFVINGYKRPYRLDRNRNGGGVIIYVREDIPSKVLDKHNFSENIEGLFVEVNLRKMKLLFFGTYHSTHPVYGLTDIKYFEQLGLALDVYSNYDKFLLAGDFNVEEDKDCLQEFLFHYNAKNLVKEKTCFKSIENPSCIDLFITNSYQNFQSTTTVATGLSDFHKMVITVLKNTFPKAKPKVIQYRDYKKFDVQNFRKDLKNGLQNKLVDNYATFEEIFLEILDNHAPLKKKILRANDKPYMTKTLRKAIMRRSALQNRFYRDGLQETEKAFKKQRNYTKRLLKKEKKRYFSNLNMNNYTDNKKFWNTVKPLFSNYGGPQKITLIEDENIITSDEELAKTFNHYFVESVRSLGIHENKALLNPTENLTDPVDIAITKFENHPSIIDIKEHVSIKTKFSFSYVEASDIITEIRNLDTKKAGTFSNISARQLKQVEEIIVGPLVEIWNKEIKGNRKFPSKLKYADLTPIFKKLECVLKENYRPVSILPVVSKIFERIMQKQMKTYIETHLSPFLCGYRKGYNTQYALISMIEKWKKHLDNSGIVGALFMDLSKAFDTLNHELLIAKLEAYGFDKEALAILLSYLSERWQRTKVNTSFSTWSDILSGVPQGSILGPLLFNIYINDLFYQIINTHVCNFADDTTLSAFSTKLEDLLHNLEYDVQSAITWFDSNYMKLNRDKCHFLVSNNVTEHLWVKVGDELIWESREEKLLGLTLDKSLNFNSHLTTLCKKVGQKVTALEEFPGCCHSIKKAYFKIIY